MDIQLDLDRHPEPMNLFLQCTQHLNSYTSHTQHNTEMIMTQVSLGTGISCIHKNKDGLG